MDRKSLIGIGLMLMLFLIWTRLNSPSQEQVAAQKKHQDSLNMAGKPEDAPKMASLPDTSKMPTSAKQDSIIQENLAGTLGGFSAAAQGQLATTVLENPKFKITFSNKGGYIQSVELKNYYKLSSAEKDAAKSPLILMNNPENRFEYILPVSNAAGGTVSTKDLYFQSEKTANQVRFVAQTADGGSFEQLYTIQADDYNIDYEVGLNKLGNTLKSDARTITLNWVNHLDKLEFNHKYERTYSTVYFKKVEESPDYCNCRKDDSETINKEQVKWVSHANQFFNTSIIANKTFSGAELTTTMKDESDPSLKVLTSQIQIPISGSGNDRIQMQMYAGPNEFKRLRAYGVYLEDVIPFGSSIFGTINRWVIRPLFDVLTDWIPSAGLVILLLTLIVKLSLSPLTYKMLYSQAKMGSLKPQLADLKKKFGDDQQKMQMESMKMYREYGVNPLGGCLPMILQMPIWLALYRFFPAAIEFRQASFLWAPDLSSYDAFFKLGTTVPFIGDHISLLTILWTVTTLIYTKYNAKNVDMSAMNNNPMFVYMQYAMPVLAMFFFNSFAAGLTLYLVFSNLINIGQTLLIKNVIINNDKIKMEMDEFRKKPKKTGGFQARLEAALKEQQKNKDAKKK
ncbi:MAG: membrane protein insertase YidC [Saprospiraceae bacterium]